MKSVLKWVIWLYIAAACAYIFYEWYSYTGLYRLAAEWQLEHYGSYQLKLTLIVPLVVLLAPAAVLVSLTGMQDQLRSATQGGGSPALFAVLGALAVAVAAGAGWYGYVKSMETVDVESFDLSKGDTPRSTHVTITGIARTEYIVEFGRKSSDTTMLDRYIPLTPANWRPGEPLVYFMKTNATAYMPPGGGGMVMLSPRTPAFQITTQSGVLIRDGLPGPVGEHYHKNKLALASPPILLDLAYGADVKPFFVTAGVSGVLGFLMLFAAGAAALRQRRQEI
ncbi:hypothetical protein [Bradyrhizobium sp. CB3481]|uniref:hypothetical protein n=1 Tax=Bradyrhizobium sp. CB3481 TaxID=3039158 RepID=UPI0024B0895D|nr:hypothetical protein [Bradyrhizobium sp. CB3481]WFU16419.1 hypothetical protein QA643_36675 [Bradyrhizobium sp. CB3481]